MKQNYNVPEWLNEDLLLTVLNEYKSIANGSIRINKFEVESATEKGENYASQMFRVICEYTKADNKPESVKLIVKTKHDRAELQTIFEQYQMYKTEILVYQKYIPEFYKILQEAGVKVQLVPEVVYCDLDREMFIMKDVAVDQFGIANRNTRYCNEGAKVLLKKLAYFHAASAVYNERNNNCLTERKPLMYAEGNDNFMPMIDQMIGAVIAVASKWTGYESYVPKLKSIRENYKKIAFQTLSPIGEGFNCLIHGDLWLNNLLVKHTKIKEHSSFDILLIDFQIASWNTPVIDLIHFFYTSLNEDDYQNRLDELIQYYHGILSDTLKNLNFKTIPTLHQLQLDFTEKFFYAFFAGCLAKSLLFAEDIAKSDIDSLLKSNSKERQESNFKSQRFQDEMKYLIKLMDQKGVLDTGNF